MPKRTPTLIGLPYDASSSFLRGPALAPQRIREALRSAAGNSWSESLRDIDAPGAMTDAGDLDLPENEGARAIIEAGIASLLAGGGTPVSLGGDHSLTYPILRAIQGVTPRPTLLHIDAHPDLYEDFERDRYSHACPFARIHDEKLVVRHVQVGIRTMNGRQQAQAERHGVEVIDMRAWTRGVRPSVSGPVYLSIDLDGLDPAFAPGVSHREPGGLSTREVITLIQECGGNLIGADVVEFNPLEDSTDCTARVAAKLVKEIVARMLDGDIRAAAGTGVA